MAKIYSIETLISKVSSAEQKLTQLVQLLALAETQERFLFGTGQHSPSDISLQINPRLREMAAIGEAMSGDIDSTLGSPEITWTNQKEFRIPPTLSASVFDIAFFNIDVDNGATNARVSGSTKLDTSNTFMRDAAAANNLMETGTPATVLISRARQSVQNGSYLVIDASSNTTNLVLATTMLGVDANLAAGNGDKTMRIVMIED